MGTRWIAAPAAALGVLAALLAGACCGGGSVAAEQAFDGGGELDWEVEVPDGNKRSLWLQYDVDCPSKRSGGETEPDYEFEGTMNLFAGDESRYTGGLLLADDDAPLDDQGGQIRAGITESCTGSGCDVAGRIKVMDLSSYGPGTHLRIEAALPTQAGSASLQSASLQIRAK